MVKIKCSNPNDLDMMKAELASIDVKRELYPIGMKTCRVGSNTLFELPDLTRKISKGNRVLMVTDATYMVREGKDLKKLVESMLVAVGFSVRRLILTGEPDVHADEATVQTVKDALHDLDCVLIVGSGTVTDICKDASFQVDPSIPMLCVQTADSVNAMSDNMAVVLRNGTKRTVPSRWVDVLIIDTQIIRDSPKEMSVAGFCDLCAQFTAPADYKLMHLLGMSDLYSEIPLALTYEASKRILEMSGGIIEGDLKALDSLSTALTLWGFGMAIVNSTACLSGTEHVIGHLLDMEAGAKKQANALHGAQVAVSAIVTAAIWQKILEELDPKKVDIDQCYPKPGKMKEMVEKAFLRIDPSGQVGEECWRDYEQKLDRWNRNRGKFQSFLDNWETHKADLYHYVRTPEEIANAMRNAKAPMRFQDLTPSKDSETVQWAILNCHLMRNRFNIIDLAFYLGLWNEKMMAEVLEKAKLVGGGL
ncbi:MAG: iron-containing alcohol dehydrogenase [Acetivibrionales bacterium]|jgi:glycerol-1-phosphate dehydrogenase [NAD(P)+]